MRVAGTVQARSNVSRALVGGLVGDAQNSFFNNTYAVVNEHLSAVSTSAQTHHNATAGGLVGFADGKTRLLHSYVVVRGNVSARQETNAAVETHAGGLVGSLDGYPTLRNSYFNASVLDANVTDAEGIHNQLNRTLEQLQCPTAPGANCQNTRLRFTYDNWANQIWDFGDNRTLPTIRDVRMRDIDDDDVGDLDDNCVRVPNRNQANLDNATGDRLGDVCDDDIDGDGLANAADNCPRIASTNQTDLDSDGEGDICDNDDDNDGILDTADNCPRLANPNQVAGDTCLDGDGDGITNTEDNCPRDANPDQANLNNATDNVGDACDPDIDGDGVLNVDEVDACLRLPGTAEDNGCPANFDSDRDGLIGSMDSCPMIYNPGSIPCTDTDGDRLADGADPCPTVSNRDCQPIANTTALEGIPKDGTTDYYLLTANLTVNTSWTSMTNFGGVFNGSDHTIANLSAPLFNTISAGALVTRIGILNSTLANTNHGEISWAYATGNVTASTSFSAINTGGLVGRNRNSGRISYSYATGDVTSVNIPIGIGGLLERATGGLVGENAGTIVYSYATGHIRADTSTASRAGGLVGLNTGVINRSYAIGNAHAIGGRAGGLVGQNGLITSNTGQVIDSYATGNSSTGTATGRAGGLIGWLRRGSVMTSYAAGNASSVMSSTFGGLVGDVDASGPTVVNSYRAQEPGVTAGDGDQHRTLAQLRCPTRPGQTCEGVATYAGWYNITTWDFGDATTLPTIQGLPPCPSFLPNCRH